MVVSERRWALQGIFGNELHGIEYAGPLSCISVGLPGGHRRGHQAGDSSSVVPACLAL